MEKDNNSSLIFVGAAIIALYLLFKHYKNKQNNSAINNNIIDPNLIDNSNAEGFFGTTSKSTEFISSMAIGTGTQGFENIRLITTKNGVDETLFTLPIMQNNSSYKFVLPDGVYDKIRISYSKGNPLGMKILNNGITYNGTNTGGTITCSNVTINGITKITAF